MPNPFARSSLRWIPVVNVDTEPAPPFGIMASSGVDSLGRIQVKRPTMSSQAGLLVNGPGQIPAGFGGQAHQTWPAIVAYDDGADDSGAAPLAGQQWGSLVDGVHNAWKLAPGQSGFAILGGAAYGRVMATAVGVMQSFAAISSSTTSTVQLFDGTKISAYPAHLAQSYTGATPGPGNLTWTNAAASVWLVDINGNTLSTGQEYAVRMIGQDVNGTQIWSPLASSQSLTVEDNHAHTFTGINTLKFLTDVFTVSNPVLGEADVTFTAGNGASNTPTSNTSLTPGAWTTYASMTVSIPSAGTYLLFMTVSVEVDKSSAGLGSVEAILYDETNAVQIGPSVLCAAFNNNQAGTNNYGVQGSGSIVWPYTFSGSVTLGLQTFFSSGGSGGSAVLIGVGASGKPATSIGYVKIG